MPFGMVSGVSGMMGVLGGTRGSFEGEFGVSHCKQWGLCCI